MMVNGYIFACAELDLGNQQVLEIVKDYMTSQPEEFFDRHPEPFDATPVQGIKGLLSRLSLTDKFDEILDGVRDREALFSKPTVVIALFHEQCEHHMQGRGRISGQIASMTWTAEHFANRFRNWWQKRSSHQPEDLLIIAGAVFTNDDDDLVLAPISELQHQCRNRIAKERPNSYAIRIEA